MRRVWAVVAGTVGMAALVSCGDSGPPSKAAWTAEHRPALAALDTDLDTARASLSSLQRPDILGSCTQLGDSLLEARKSLPVPDPASDAALRTGFDAIAVGVEDCIQGARGPNIPQLEKSFGELREANTLMEVATRTIDAWR
ncbi:MAG: hypothetical protein ACR2KK_19635 [Acidimicrobiales bacterium]